MHRNREMISRWWLTATRTFTATRFIAWPTAARVTLLRRALATTSGTSGSNWRRATYPPYRASAASLPARALPVAPVSETIPREGREVAPPLTPPTATTTTPAANDTVAVSTAATSSPAAVDSSSFVDVSISAFAAMERNFALKRIQQAREDATAAAATATAAPLDAAAVSASASPTAPAVGVPAGVLTKPREPDFNECCGNGCSNCIWITYAEQMIEYEQKLAAAAAAVAATAAAKS